MARAYRGLDRNLQRPVAIKVLSDALALIPSMLIASVRMRNWSPTCAIRTLRRFTPLASKTI
jgi:hypothetical protein